ncbi:MAG: FkbM family methyltransferase [Saccharofermentans sp.]|nr:FkbM family methyltransferase [Saccharofermentans sp.]
MDLWQYLKTTNKPVVLYGTGNGADKIIDKMEQDGSSDKIKAIFASSGFVRNKKFRGFQIESYEDVKARLGDMIVLMCFGSNREEVLQNVYRIAEENEFYAPDVPVYGGVIFDEAFFEENKLKIEEVKSCLADDLSRQTMDDTVNYKLTGDIKYLCNTEVSADEADALFNLPEGSCFVDLGAYNGDTVLRYTTLFPQINEIHAVEPDSRNFRKLNENTSHLKVNYYNALISDEVGEARMARNKGRGNSVSSDGEIIIPAITVDSIMNGRKVDFIKFDVEGNEHKAIIGAQETIRKYRPQMLMSCYHRSEDIFDLALQVLKINPEYKVYMRHLPYVPCWDTAFYFV